MLKKAKIIILILFTSILTAGCSADYTIQINKETIDENIYLNTGKSTFAKLDDDNDDLTRVTLEMLNFEKNYNNFEMKFKQINSQSGYEYKTIFDVENGTWPTIASECYDSVNIEKNENTLTITTSNEFLCFDKYSYLKKVNVKLISDLKVESHNADNVNDNTYTWEINKVNSAFKPLEITFDINESSPNQKDFPIIVVFIGIASILIIGIVIFIKKRTTSNEF
jgi:hypothetical protein